MEENNNVVVTEASDGDYEASYMPAEEFKSAKYVPSTDEKDSIGGPLFVGAAAIVGVATGLYGMFKGVRYLGKVYKAGVEALKQQEECVEDDSDLVDEVDAATDENQVKEFVEKRKNEK